MEWTYVIVAITFLVIGFMLCALLSANRHEEEYINIEEILRAKEVENEDE